MKYLSASTSRALWLASPSTVPTARPASTRTPSASTRPCWMMPMVTPAAGNTPLSTSAVTELNLAERSRL